MIISELAMISDSLLLILNPALLVLPCGKQIGAHAQEEASELFSWQPSRNLLCTVTACLLPTKFAIRLKTFFFSAAADLKPRDTDNHTCAKAVFAVSCPQCATP